MEENTIVLKHPEDILFYAFRYTLGRRSYSVSTVVEELMSNYENLSESTKSTIVKEIEKYQKEFGKVGSDMDHKMWMEVKWLFDKSRKVKIKAQRGIPGQKPEWNITDAIRGENGKYYSIPEMYEFAIVKEEV